MKTTISLVALVLLRAKASALDLTLRHNHPSDTDPSVDVTYWMNGNSKIYVQLPENWKASSSAQAVTFFPVPAQCEVRVQSVAESPKVAGTVVATTSGAQLPVAIPAGATDIALIAESGNPLPIFNWSGREATYSYTFQGTPFKRSFIELTVSKMVHLQIIVIARAADFAVIHAQALSIFQSWFEPAKDLPPERARTIGHGSGA